MASTRRNSSGGSNLDTIIINAGYGHVIFADNDQKVKFKELMGRPIAATRFLDLETLEALGLKQGMKKTLKKSGCEGLYKMCEHTYRCLTLEFLSSFYYDEEEPAVNFRLFNNDHCLYPTDWGNSLGCRSDGVINTSEPRDGIEALWTALTGLEKGGPGWRFRCHLIHHPVLRLWGRLIGATYFARPESTNMKSMEVHMLFSALNIDGGERFDVNVAHFVAKHFENVAWGVVKPIMVGGVITHIAKSLYDNIREHELELVAGSSSGEPLKINFTNLSRLHYIRTLSENSWMWKVGATDLVELPETGMTMSVRPIKTFRRSGPANFSYYLITESESEDTEEAELPVLGVSTIDPIGDYSRLQHYPFSTAPYRPEGYDPAMFPPTFATYPPFEEPRTWNTNTRDSMLMGLCNQMHQVHLDRSLGDHNIYAYHDSQGHFPPGTVHPQYYQPQVNMDYQTPMMDIDHAEGSQAGSRASAPDRSFHYTDQQEDEGRQNDSSYTWSSYWRRQHRQ